MTKNNKRDSPKYAKLCVFVDTFQKGKTNDGGLYSTVWQNRIKNALVELYENHFPDDEVADLYKLFAVKTANDDRAMIISAHKKLVRTIKHNKDTQKMEDESSKVNELCKADEICKPFEEETKASEEVDETKAFKDETRKPETKAFEEVDETKAFKDETRKPKPKAKKAKAKPKATESNILGPKIIKPNKATRKEDTDMDAYLAKYKTKHSELCKRVYFHYIHSLKCVHIRSLKKKSKNDAGVKIDVDRKIFDVRYLLINPIANIKLFVTYCDRSKIKSVPNYFILLREWLRDYPQTQKLYSPEFVSRLAKLDKAEVDVDTDYEREVDCEVNRFALSLFSGENSSRDEDFEIKKLPKELGVNYYIKNAKNDVKIGIEATNVGTDEFFTYWSLRYGTDFSCLTSYISDVTPYKPFDEIVPEYVKRYYDSQTHYSKKEFEDKIRRKIVFYLKVFITKMLTSYYASACKGKSFEEFARLIGSIKTDYERLSMTTLDTSLLWVKEAISLRKRK